MNLLDLIKAVVGLGNHSDGEVSGMVNADWPNQEEHQEWLQEATPQEVDDWVSASE